MAFRPGIVALALFVLATLLWASQVGLVDALIIVAGYVLLGLLLREMDNAKRAKRRSHQTDE